MRPASLVALYHAVGSPETTGYRDALALAALEQQLAWLRRHYRVLPLAELLARRRAGQSLDGLAALTFDDNHRSVLDLALPLAASLGLPATWCLIAAPLFGRPFWRDLVRRIAAAGQVPDFLAFAEAHGLNTGGLRPERFYRDSKDPARVDVAALVPLLRAFLPDQGPPDDFVRESELLGSAPAGVTLASHSDSHPVFAGMGLEAQRLEIELGRSVARLRWPWLDAFALPFGGPATYDAATLQAAAAAAVEGLLLTGEGKVAADDLTLHPLAAGAALPVLVRSLPARWPAEVFED